jgi:hypothetical protein
VSRVKSLRILIRATIFQHTANEYNADELAAMLEARRRVEGRDLMPTIVVVRRVSITE